MQMVKMEWAKLKVNQWDLAQIVLTVMARGMKVAIQNLLQIK